MKKLIVGIVLSVFLSPGIPVEAGAINSAPQCLGTSVHLQTVQLQKTFAVSPHTRSRPQERSPALTSVIGALAVILGIITTTHLATLPLPELPDTLVPSPPVFAEKHPDPSSATGAIAATTSLNQSLPETPEFDIKKGRDTTLFFNQIPIPVSGLTFSPYARLWTINDPPAQTIWQDIYRVSPDIYEVTAENAAEIIQKQYPGTQIVYNASGAIAEVLIGFGRLSDEQQIIIMAAVDRDAARSLLIGYLDRLETTLIGTFAEETAGSSRSPVPLQVFIDFIKKYHQTVKELEVRLPLLSLFPEEDCRINLPRLVLSALNDPQFALTELRRLVYSDRDGADITANLLLSVEQLIPEAFIPIFADNTALPFIESFLHNQNLSPENRWSMLNAFVRYPQTQRTVARMSPLSTLTPPTPRQFADFLTGFVHSLIYIENATDLIIQQPRYDTNMQIIQVREVMQVIGPIDPWLGTATLTNEILSLHREFNDLATKARIDPNAEPIVLAAELLQTNDSLPANTVSAVRARILISFIALYYETAIAEQLGISDIGSSYHAADYADAAHYLNAGLIDIALQNPDELPKFTPAILTALSVLPYGQETVSTFLSVLPPGTWQSDVGQHILRMAIPVLEAQQNQLEAGKWRYFLRQSSDPSLKNRQPEITFYDIRPPSPAAKPGNGNGLLQRQTAPLNSAPPATQSI